MKVCFVGLGSIGTRHLKNLRYVCNKRGIFLEVHSLKFNTGRLTSDVVKLVDKVVYKIDELDDKYDIIFLTNPTNLHFKSLCKLNRYSKNFFIEKPVFDNEEYNLEEIGLHTDGNYYVACPIRYTNVIKFIKQFIRDNKVYCARAICSSYLPEWRPGVDYRTIYSASKEKGGGVCIDLIHEWDYLSYLFGMPEKLKVFYDKVSNLEIDSEDLAIYIAKYRDKMIELHLDYFGRKTRRVVEIYTEKGEVVADIINSEVRFLGKEENIKFEEEPNDKYVREIEYFLDICNGKKENNNDIFNAIKVLKITKGK